MFVLLMAQCLEMITGFTYFQTVLFIQKLTAADQIKSSIFSIFVSIALQSFPKRIQLRYKFISQILINCHRTSSI